MTMMMRRWTDGREFKDAWDKQAVEGDNSALLVLVVENMDSEKESEQELEDNLRLLLGTHPLHQQEAQEVDKLAGLRLARVLDIRQHLLDIQWHRLDILLVLAPRGRVLDKLMAGDDKLGAVQQELV
jgi:hypothetical protein